MPSAKSASLGVESDRGQYRSYPATGKTPGFLCDCVELRRVKKNAAPYGVRGGYAF